MVRPFVLLWIGQSVSQLGSQVTLVALPLTAILVLGATPVQVGLLTAAGFAPAAIVGLLAGVYVDRVRRRPLQICCQWVLAATTFSVPVAAWLGVLRLENLFALQTVNGALTVVSSAAGQAYLPSIVERERLTEANARLTTSTAVSRIVGPGFAGVLVQLASAPTAIAVDAVSFVFSAVCLQLIDAPEPAASSSRKRGIASDIQEGLYLVLGHRLIRPMMVSAAMYNFFAAIFVAVYTVFMVRELGLEPASIGAIVSSGGVGGVIGSLAAEPAAKRFGMGRAIVGGMVVLAVMHLAAPAAVGPAVVTVPLLAGAGLIAQLAVGVLSVNRTTMIQQIVPTHAQGRVAATQQVVVLAAVPLGAVLGGLIAELVGLRATIGIAAVGTIVATLALIRSPLWSTSAVAPIEDLAEGDGPLALFESERQMRAVADDVVQQRIAAELMKTTFARPLFDGSDQGPSNPAAPYVGIHPPAFDKRAWLLVDAISERAQASLHHAAQATSGPLGDEDHLVRIGHHRVDFGRKLGRVGVRPQRGPHANVLHPIASNDPPHAD